MLNYTMKLFACSSFLVLPYSGCLAEEYPFIVESLPHHLQSRIEKQASVLQVSTVSSAEDYFIDKVKLWNNNNPIRFCIFGGSTQLRKKIARIASEWATVGSRVPLDFGDMNAPSSCVQNQFYQIRIGFQYKGYWSMVGTDSVNIAAQNEQSMNFALFNVNPPLDKKFSRIVLHEFGHALGLHHEHQSYKSPCKTEFNWDAIYTYLQGPPNYWSVEKIDHNLRPRGDNANNDASKFDRKSIMLYSFPVSFYKEGTAAECYTHGNHELSEEDKVAISKFYPSSIAEAQIIRESGLTEFNDRVDALPISEISKSIAKVSADRISSTDSNNGFNGGSTVNLPTSWQYTVGSLDSTSVIPQFEYFDRSQFQISLPNQ